jgi:hypothetical protein
MRTTQSVSEIVRRVQVLEAGYALVPEGTTDDDGQDWDEDGAGIQEMLKAQLAVIESYLRPALRKINEDAAREAIKG